MLDLKTSVSLLSMIARKLGYDWLLLRSESEQCEKKYCSAVFGNHKNFDTELLEVDGKGVSIKYIDVEDHLRSDEDMYAELVGLLYKILENGGKLSDGRIKLSAEEVPEFMIECVLNGYAYID